jgi:arsenate reductase (glutaredoxin)
VLRELGVDHEVVEYLKTPPDRATLERLVAGLEDDPTDLVRRDARFAKLGLTDDDVSTPEQVVDLLVREKALLQRPVLVRGDRAVIGRPKSRIAPFVAGA